MINKKNTSSFSTVEQKDIPPEILECKDPNEKILWVGKPQKYIAYLPYNFNFMVAFIPSFIIMILLIFIGDPRNSYNSLFIIILFCVCVSPFLTTYLMYDSTNYAISNRRIIVRMGIFSNNVYSIDFDKITDIIVRQNILEKNCGLGSILPAPGYQISRGFLAIKDHAVLSGMMKSLVVDIKTDWNYPNSKRQKKNPGYKTTYSFDKEEE